MLCELGFIKPSLLIAHDLLNRPSDNGTSPVHRQPIRPSRQVFAWFIGDISNKVKMLSSGAFIVGRAWFISSNGNGRLPRNQYTARNL